MQRRSSQRDMTGSAAMKSFTCVLRVQTASLAQVLGVPNTGIGILALVGPSIPTAPSSIPLELRGTNVPALAQPSPPLVPLPPLPLLILTSPLLLPSMEHVTSSDRLAARFGIQLRQQTLPSL